MFLLAFSSHPFSRGIRSSPCLRASLSVCHLYRSCVSMHLLACVLLFMCNLFVYLFVFCLSLFIYLLMYLFIRSFVQYLFFVRLSAPVISVRFFSFINLLLVRLFVRSFCSSACLFVCLFVFFISLLLVRSLVCFFIYSFTFAPTFFLSQIRPFAAELLSNTHGAGFQALRVTPDQLPTDRMLAEVVIHTAAVLQCMYRGSLVEPLRMLMEQPAGMNVRTIERSRITDRTFKTTRWTALACVVKFWAAN